MMEIKFCRIKIVRKNVLGRIKLFLKYYLIYVDFVKVFEFEGLNNL